MPALFHIIRAMNRGVACEGVNAVAVQVLLNIAKVSGRSTIVLLEGRGSSAKVIENPRVHDSVEPRISSPASHPPNGLRD